MWFMPVGASAHFLREMRKELNVINPVRRIEVHGPVAWPPLSLDLNLLNFLIWAHLKSGVYEPHVNTTNDLIELIVVAPAVTNMKHTVSSQGIWFTPFLIVQ